MVRRRSSRRAVTNDRVAAASPSPPPRPSTATTATTVDDAGDDAAAASKTAWHTATTVTATTTPLRYGHVAATPASLLPRQSLTTQGGDRLPSPPLFCRANRDDNDDDVNVLSLHPSSLSPPRRRRRRCGTHHDGHDHGCDASRHLPAQCQDGRPERAEGGACTDTEPRQVVPPPAAAVICQERKRHIERDHADAGFGCIGGVDAESAEGGS
ncbi:hypothetical protein L210DRAFT_989671 [Boletus edulis BED1]|uniref:Uncharacterized protein n=1 Tax=Boletus edulis BED1 TaxID=1328754 RepID=A0AAD4BAN5_BOLED|nr:hypothetical protein L210DRAFT_989671 [Boletus edulis BED1]